MMRYLLLIALLFLLLSLIRRARASRSATPPPAPRAPEVMVKCARCGVNQPLSESILTHGRYYCCAAHRREDEHEGEADEG